METRRRRSLTRSSEFPEIGCAAPQQSSGRCRHCGRLCHRDTYRQYLAERIRKLCSLAQQSRTATHLEGCDRSQERSCLSNSFTAKLLHALHCEERKRRNYGASMLPHVSSYVHYFADSKQRGRESGAGVVAARQQPPVATATAASHIQLWLVCRWGCRDLASFHRVRKF